MNAKAHLNGKVQLQTEIKPKLSKKLLFPAVLAAAVYGSVSLDVGGSAPSPM